MRFCSFNNALLKKQINEVNFKQPHIHHFKIFIRETEL